MNRIPIYLESAPKRTFAVALAWPGWARSGRTEADALAALAACAPRYAWVVGEGAGFVEPSDSSAFDIVERLTGNATTEFGAPGGRPAADDAALDAAELERQLAILDAAWKALDRTAKVARGATLRKGPRGGGRTLPKILDHVLDAETGYLSALGARYRGPNDIAELRRVGREAIIAAARYEPLADPSAVKKRWPPRFFIRRSAWHILDHAWEIEDRARPTDTEPSQT
ncbi:MAG: hypothetical protein ACXWWQ_00210 [Candidatus Limnocylindria bacterium]